MESTGYEGRTERQDGYLGLLGLILGLATGGALLYTVAGPPHLPAGLPNLEVILFTLRGSYLPPEVLAYVLTTAAWTVWAWIVASVLLRLLVVGAEILTHGAAWVQSFRVISDLVTLPVVRRLVDGALVALIVVNVVSQPATSAAADNTQPRAIVFAASFGDAAPGSQAWESKREERALPATQYAVRPGDTLWSIAERFYGTGHEYPRLVAANAGRQMLDGRRFTQAGVIYPGWVLLVPLASQAVEEARGQAYYVVEEGDTLRGIAARLLNDESRWPEIFQMNRGTARLEDGHVLKDPGLIWPGLRLNLPCTAPASDVETPAPGPTSEPVAGEHVDPATTPAIEAQPTPIPASPTGEATAGKAPIPLPPAVLVEPEPAPTDGTASALVYGAAGMSVAAAVAAATFLARRRVRRSLDELPIRAMSEGGSPPSGDFAEAEFGRVLTHRLHGDEVEPVVLVAEQALRFLDGCGVREASAVTAQKGRNSVTLAMSVRLVDQPRVLELVGELGARLGGSGQGTLTPDHDVALHFSGLKSAALFASPPYSGPAAPMRLLPLGVLPRGQTLYANWRELGHVLLAGLPGGGTEVVLTSLISALTACCRPEELGLWTIADRRLLPAQILRFPHQCGTLVDPADEAAVSRILQQVRTELIRRMRRSEHEGALQRPVWSEEPDLVLAIGELGSVKDDGSTLELIGVHGPAHGVRLLATTTYPAILGDDLLAHFQTRVVLQTLDDDESIRLLGQPDAADLGTGDLLLRIDGRVPVRARGFRVSSDRLDELVRLMREAYGHETPPGGGKAASPEEAEAGTRVAPDGEKMSAGSEPGRAEDRVASLPEPSSGPEVDSSQQPLDLAGFNRVDELGPPADRISGGETSQVDIESAAGTGEDEERSTGSQDRPEFESAPSTDRVVLPPTTAASEDEEPSYGHHGDTMPEDAVVAKRHSGMKGVTPEAVSLVQVRCFGEFVVTSGEREITPSSEEGASFKAWEVLAFLAAQPDGAVSKENLLAAVWPDVDPERAGNRMRVAMVRLRALLARQVPGLPSEAVRADRDGTCRLDTSVISSDVHQFAALCRIAPKLAPEESKSALQQALTLYAGDLLPGRGTRLYEWVDERDGSGVSLREGYREEYCRATQRLARLFSGDGRPDLAVPLYKGLLKAEPTLEDIVRELYRCYQQLGDLSSLIREDRHLRQALREAYYDPDDPEDDPACYEPEPDTVELFNDVRSELEGKAARSRDLQLVRRA